MTTSPETPGTPETLQWLPAEGAPQQLMLLLHGVGASAQQLVPLAEHLRREFPQCAVVARNGFDPFDGAFEGCDGGWQWFSVKNQTDETRRNGVEAALPHLAGWVRQMQAATGVGPQATAIFGYSQGAIMALELAQRHDGIAGRVIAFAGRYATLPQRPLEQTTLHLLHGMDDTVIDVVHAREAMEAQGSLRGDCTIDILHGVGHELPPAMIDEALYRLRSHIPHRSWRAAMGAVPELQGKTSPDH